MVCPFCLREFDDVIAADMGESSPDEGVMFCPVCYGVSLVYKTGLGIVHLRKPDPDEQRAMDNDPFVQSVLAEARRHGPPPNE